MAIKPKTFPHNLKFILFAIILFVSSIVLFGQDSTTTAEKGITGDDVFTYVIAIGYLLGILILLPWILYTNAKEKLTPVDPANYDVSGLRLNEEERNKQAHEILIAIENKLTSINQDGEDLVTITKGSQARFMKKSIEYIKQFLMPTDPEIIDRMNEFIAVYEDRTKRFFTGSKWVIIAAVGMAAFMVYVSGFSSFIVIHGLGTIFYILSSRTPLYILEKRMDRFSGGGMISALFSGLFIGAGAKHYNVYSDGRRERDYSSEFTGGAIFLLIIFVVAMFVAFLVAVFGVLNFVLNYSNNALIPGNLQTWYDKNFIVNPNQEV